MPVSTIYVNTGANKMPEDSDSAETRRSKLLGFIRWYFLPTGSLPGYTVRVGIFWFSPIMFLSSYLLATEHDHADWYVRTAVRCLFLGLIYGLGGYPIGRWALRKQAKIDTRRRRREP